MWWNFFGLAAVLVVTAAVCRLTPDPDAQKLADYTLSGTGFFEEIKRWGRTYLILGIYFFVIFAVLLACTIAARLVAG